MNIIDTDTNDLVKLMASTVAEAIDECAPGASTETGCYLSHLLVHLVTRADRVDMDRPLCLWLNEAQSYGLHSKAQHCRAIGDTAVAKTGLFRPRMVRSPVSPSYLLGFGRSAYQQAASLQRYFGMDVELIEELEAVADEIEMASDILAHVGARLFPDTQDDLLVHYEHAMDIKSDYSRRLLLDAGIITIDVPMDACRC